MEVCPKSPEITFCIKELVEVLSQKFCVVMCLDYAPISDDLSLYILF